MPAKRKPKANANGGQLTPRQARFVDEYLIDLNATQAAIRAGYAAGKSAEVTGARMLGNAKVSGAIAARQVVRSERVGFTADEVLRELGILVRSDVRDFAYDASTGELTLREGAPDEAWRAVASVKRKVRLIPQKDGAEPIVERELELRLWDKNPALDKAMKHLGLLKEGAGLTINQQNVMIWRFGDREVRF